MKHATARIVKKFFAERTLDESEYLVLLEQRSRALARVLADEAVRVRKEYYGNTVYIRGLVEISNVCKNDCRYCGIRKSNSACERYRLTTEELLACCAYGYTLGFRTFVLQGGEDAYFTDEVLCSLIRTIKARHPDCAITLSLGERSYASYKRLFIAGADRYLLRHETADPAHYARLHPPAMSFERRVRCLEHLKEIGYQVGCGFMVGSPYQTPSCLAKDLKFIERLQPAMCGIGPFISHSQTPFSAYDNGDSDLTCYLLSLIRILQPSVLLPATTALGRIEERGQEKGILSGANAIMFNISPQNVRDKYCLYDGVESCDRDTAEQLKKFTARMHAIGYRIAIDRGDGIVSRAP